MFEFNINAEMPLWLSSPAQASGIDLNYLPHAVLIFLVLKLPRVIPWAVRCFYRQSIFGPLIFAVAATTFLHLWGFHLHYVIGTLHFQRPWLNAGIAYRFWKVYAGHSYFFHYLLDLFFTLDLSPPHEPETLWEVMFHEPRTPAKILDDRWPAAVTWIQLNQLKVMSLWTTICYMWWTFFVLRAVIICFVQLVRALLWVVQKFGLFTFETWLSIMQTLILRTVQLGRAVIWVIRKLALLIQTIFLWADEFS